MCFEINIRLPMKSVIILRFLFSNMYSNYYTKTFKVDINFFDIIHFFASKQYVSLEADAFLYLLNLTSSLVLNFSSSGKINNYRKLYSLGDFILSKVTNLRN